LAKILLVEDNDSTRLLYERILVEHDVVSTDNADHTFEMLDAEPFDLVILDMHLPTVQGMDILRSMRSFPEYANVPVIAISSDDRLRYEAQDIGIQNWITKPIKVEDLIKAVNQAVG
jgi:DNA-binding response OmpR family regulator